MEPSTQPNNETIEHISITHLESIKYLALRFMTDTIGRLISGPRLDNAGVIERDLCKLLEDTRSKAYVKGFKAGQSVNRKAT